MIVEAFPAPTRTGPEACGECRYEYDMVGRTLYEYGPEVRHTSLADCLRAALRRTLMLEYKTKDLEARILLLEKHVGRRWWRRWRWPV
jgi:hypothetical protein